MAKTEEKEMSGTITSLGFNSDNPIDKELISEANTFASRKENEGIPRLSVLRNFFIRKLREANEPGNRSQQAKAS